MREEGEANAGHAPSAVRASKSPLQAIGTGFFFLYPSTLAMIMASGISQGILPRQQCAGYLDRRTCLGLCP